MATNNQINVSLLGKTGTGNIAGTTSPTFVTPTVGAADATSIAFSSTTEIIGTTTNDDTDAGNVGELLQTIQSAGHALTTATNDDLASVSLTAGDWVVYALAGFSPGAGTTTTLERAGISATSVTLPTIGAENNSIEVIHSSALQEPIYLPINGMRVSLSSTTTYYLVGSCTFTGGAGVTGVGVISARRIR